MYALPIRLNWNTVWAKMYFVFSLLPFWSNLCYGKWKLLFQSNVTLIKVRISLQAQLAALRVQVPSTDFCFEYAWSLPLRLIDHKSNYLLMNYQCQVPEQECVFATVKESYLKKLK